MAEYIEREKAIETVKFYDGYNDPIPWAVDSLKVIPAADVRPVVRGKWERKPDPFGFFDDIPVCSNCGNTTKWRETYLFCPNCGARMDKDGDGE